MTEIAKRTFYQYLTAFHLTMAVFLLLIQSYGIPDTWEQAVVYVAVALLGGFVYSTDKKTGIEGKKIELTPLQEYDIKKWFEMICELFGLKMTVEKPAEVPEQPIDQPDISDLTRDEILKMIEEKMRDGASDSG